MSITEATELPWMWAGLAAYALATVAPKGTDPVDAH